MSNENPITPKIKRALIEGARQIKADCDSEADALGYVRELCYDVNSDLELDWEGDYDLEQALREAAKEAIAEVCRR